MKLKDIVLTGFTALMALTQSCTSSGYAGANGGEVTGSSKAALREPVPYGMVLVKRGSSLNGQSVIEINGLNDGIYFLKIVTSDGTSTKKIIKK